MKCYYSFVNARVCQSMMDIQVETLIQVEVEIQENDYIAARDDEALQSRIKNEEE